MKTPEGCEQFVTLSLLFGAWSRGAWSRAGFCGEVPALTTAVVVGLFTFLSLLSTVNYLSQYNNNNLNKPFHQFTEPALGMCEVCGRTGPPILRGPPNFG